MFALMERKNRLDDSTGQLIHGLHWYQVYPSIYIYIHLILCRIGWRYDCGFCLEVSTISAPSTRPLYEVPWTIRISYCSLCMSRIVQWKKRCFFICVMSFHHLPFCARSPRRCPSHRQEIEKSKSWTQWCLNRTMLHGMFGCFRFIF